MINFDTAAVTAKVEELIARDGLTGVSICIKGPEGIVFEKGYGYRNADKNITPDPDTMFGIASMSKSITSLAISILEAEGKLSWEDPVHKYFPNFRVPGAARDTVTLRTLAMHTSGIPPMEPLEWSIAMNSVNRQSEWIDQMRRTSPNSMSTIDQIIDYIAVCPYPTVGAPGENMSYSNEGYAILSYVVDMVAGIPLEEFCMEHIFKPLGMTRTIMDDDCASAKEMSCGNITSLFENEDGKIVCDDDWSVLPPFRGCAMVKSTARDMAEYYRCLSNGGMVNGAQAIPREAVDALIGDWLPSQEIACYGLGLYKRVKCGHTICEHSGGLHGVSTKGGLLLGEGYGFAVLCNLGDADMDDIMCVLYNAVMGTPLDMSHRWFVPVGHAFSDPEMLSGSYICYEGVPAVVEISAIDGKLTGIVSKTDVNLVYCGGTRFLTYDEKGNLKSRLEFFIRNGHAWGVRVGSRIYTIK